MVSFRLALSRVILLYLIFVLVYDDLFYQSQHRGKHIGIIKEKGTAAGNSNVEQKLFLSIWLIIRKSYFDGFYSVLFYVV